MDRINKKFRIKKGVLLHYEAEQLKTKNMG